MSITNARLAAIGAMLVASGVAEHTGPFRHWRRSSKRRIQRGPSHGAYRCYYTTPAGEFFKTFSARRGVKYSANGSCP